MDPRDLMAAALRAHGCCHALRASTDQSSWFWRQPLFGALTIVFELFTGGIPLGLAMVIGLASLGARSDRSTSGVPAGSLRCGGLRRGRCRYLPPQGRRHCTTWQAMASSRTLPGGCFTIRRPRNWGQTFLRLPARSVKSIGVLAGGMTLLAWAAVLGGVVGRDVWTEVDPSSGCQSGSPPACSPACIVRCFLFRRGSWPFRTR